MTEQDYRSQPGLSFSSMKDLAISPYRFWHLHVNPNAPLIEPTAAMQFGSALHCRVLEPSEFENRYACAISPADFDGCLETMDDLRGWLRARGVAPKGTRKADAIAQVQSVDSTVPIFEVLQAQHTEDTRGKILLSQDDWARVRRCAESLLSEPRVQEVLSEGHAEAPLFAADPDTGIPLKGKLDWLSDAWTLDVKTFSQTRGKSIDETVNDAIWYERYYRQAYTYSFLRSLQPGFEKPGIAAVAPPFMIAFVESEEPHEVRIRVLRSKVGCEPNMYWLRARDEVRMLTRTYAECIAHFGTDKPWRYAQEADALQDEDMKQLAYA